MPAWLKRFAREMKLQLRVLYLASRDPRTPLVAKLVLLAIVAYALSPIDLIPDFIPVLGYLDDLILLPLGIYLAAKLVPPELWRELQARAETEPLSLPKSRRGAAFVIVCWLAVLALVGYWLRRCFWTPIKRPLASQEDPGLELSGGF
ncbi:YkvA family protein [Microbulbifer sp.]|uniref:YkvA family protein n=1 Tax=Microbulbifer sp. TaxID=1908541 RepID=UPI003F3CD395